jgi:hypothetical protein
MLARRLLLLGLSLPGLFSLATLRGAAPPERVGGDRPRLAVLVFFDQMRGDYLSRWQVLFGEGGFRRLQQGGAWFVNCHYPYAYTVTGAGHASVATGCSPDVHGIVGNDWYDRVAHKDVYCVGSDRYEQVPAPVAKEKADRKEGSSPDRLLAPTLADALKQATAGRARVVSLSLKDRSAVLPGGRRPDACSWLKAGRFVTSTYYRERPHPWVRDFNASGAADAWLGKSWQRLRPDLDYVKWSGPDDVKGEGVGSHQGRTFPHPFGLGPKRRKSVYYSALTSSPFGNDVLLDLALRAIDAERLGTRATPDLLCLSFSSNDLVGHAWGPDSQEVLDITLRSDGIVRRLLDHLDARVGKGRYVLALTADHGVCPLPEVARARGHDAGRIEPALLRQRAEDFLDGRFPARAEAGGSRPSWLEAQDGPWLYLNGDLIRRRGLKQPAVEQALARWAASQRGVQTVYTRTQLLAGLPAGDGLGQKVRRSFHPQRSGDVVLIEKPYYLITKYLTGTTHGTPHPYDTHVPLLVYGPGIRKGTRKDAVTPQAAAVILARALGIAPPAQARAEVPAGLFASGR